MVGKPDGRIGVPRAGKVVMIKIIWIPFTSRCASFLHGNVISVETDQEVFDFHAVTFAEKHFAVVFVKDFNIAAEGISCAFGSPLAGKIK